VLDIFFQLFLIVDSGLAPRFVVVRFQANIKFAIEESDRVGPSSGRPSSEPTTVTMGYLLRILRISGANLAASSKEMV